MVLDWGLLEGIIDNHEGIIKGLFEGLSSSSVSHQKALFLGGGGYVREGGLTSHNNISGPLLV